MKDRGKPSMKALKKRKTTRERTLAAALRRDDAFRRTIRSIPQGRVASYGQIAAAAGYPGLSRAVARFLKTSPSALPWQRVVGAGGEIKLPREAGAEQRFRLEMEGVRFSGRKVNMREHGHKFPKKRT
jgi:methylated-DNA-protein-cysteine methyltransferase-like protein